MKKMSLVLLSASLLVATVSQAAIPSKVTCTSTINSEVVYVDFSNPAQVKLSFSDGTGTTPQIDGAIDRKNTEHTIMHFRDAQGAFGIEIIQAANGEMTATSSSLSGAENSYSCK